LEAAGECPLHAGSCNIGLKMQMIFEVFFGVYLLGLKSKGEPEC